MRKFLTFLLLIIFCSFSLPVLAQDAQPQQATQQTAAVAAKETEPAILEEEPYEAAQNDAATEEQSAKKEKDTAAKDELETCIPVETISVEEMQQRLQHKSDKDLLYIKIGDTAVYVYQGLATDRSLRKQLILKLPNTEMLRLYTTNKATYEQMNKMLSDYERHNTNFNGYRIITDKDNPQKLADGGKVYRFWFMKIEREKTARSGGWGFPIGIGIGIGGHHHHGSWIGVGL